jgi:hypothetical protein
LTQQSSISDVQSQELMDVISSKCEELDLNPEQILDGIARSLLGASVAFGTKDLKVDIENVGTVQVSVEDGENS